MEKKITIRIPDDVHAALIALAKRDTRSLNGEIITLLREAIAGRESQKAPPKNPA